MSLELGSEGAGRAVRSLGSCSGEANPRAQPSSKSVRQLQHSLKTTKPVYHRKSFLSQRAK